MDFLISKRKHAMTESNLKKIKLDKETGDCNLSLEKRKEIIEITRKWGVMVNEIKKLSEEAHGFFGVETTLFFSYQDALDFCEKNGIKKKKIGWAAAAKNNPAAMMLGFYNAYGDDTVTPETSSNEEKKE